MNDSNEDMKPETERLQAGWIHALAIHTGSRRGKDGKFMRLAAEAGALLPQEGFRTLYYGDGDSGTMGEIARSAIANGADVHGISLIFFHACQGKGPPGKKSMTVANDMHERMQDMRAPCQAAIVFPGSFGTIEEGGEWVLSRSDIVKPQIFVNFEGYYDGFKAYLDLHRAPQDAPRIHFVATPQELVAKLHELNAQPATPEPDSHVLTAAQAQALWADSIEETEHALIVKPDAELAVMSMIFTRFVAYDLSNVPDQPLFPEGGIIKPFIFAGEHGCYDGLRRQFATVIYNEFVPSERMAFFRFTDTMEDARRIAAVLDAQPPFLPTDLIHTQAEALIPPPPSPA